MIIIYSLVFILLVFIGAIVKNSRPEE